MSENRIAEVTKEWTEERWPRKKVIKVQAQQTEMPEIYGGLAALAKVTISVNGEVAHEAEIPWAMPKGEVMLPLQVYLLAKYPDYEHPEWQPVMEQFAFKCEGFAPPEELWWSKEPLFF